MFGKRTVHEVDFVHLVVLFKHFKTNNYVYDCDL